MSGARPTTGPLVDLAAIEHRIAQVDAEAKRGIAAPADQSERRYRHLVENSLGLICTHDLEGTVLSVNPAAAQSLGYEPHEGIGKNLREFLAPDTQHLFDAYLQRLRQHQSDSGLMRVVRRDGTERVWLYRNVRYDEPGTSPFVLGHAIDITERVAAEAALRQSERALKRAHDELEERVRARTAELSRANDALRAETEERQRLEEQVRETQKLEALGRFAGGVAHDFNNLLTVIMASSELLALNVHEDTSLTLVEDVRRAAERAAALTRQLLAFGRRQMIVRQALDLNLVIGQLENMTRRLIGAHIELSLSLETEIPSVRADWGQMEQVVLNLVANARDAMPQGGRLTIGTRAATIERASMSDHAGMVGGRYVVLSVRDTGCGIDAERAPTSSSPSLRPSHQVRAPALALRRSTASSARPAATFPWRARLRKARSSRSTCPRRYRRRTISHRTSTRPRNQAAAWKRFCWPKMKRRCDRSCGRRWSSRVTRSSMRQIAPTRCVSSTSTQDPSTCWSPTS